MTRAVTFENVSIVFGDRPERALPLMDEGKSRAEIQAATGQILGVHDCSLEVETGEILVLMGLSGSGKSTLLRAVNGLNPVARGAVHIGSGEMHRDRIPVAGLHRVRHVGHSFSIIVAGYLLESGKFDVEVQILSSKRVIGIDDNRRFIHR